MYSIGKIKKTEAPLFESQGGEMVSPCYLEIDSVEKSVSLNIGESDSSRSRKGLAYTFKVPCSLSYRQCNAVLLLAKELSGEIDFSKSIEENRENGVLQSIVEYCAEMIGEVDVFPVD